MGHPEDQSTGPADVREEVARGQEVAIVLGGNTTQQGQGILHRSGSRLLESLFGCGKGAGLGWPERPRMPGVWRSGRELT